MATVIINISRVGRNRHDFIVEVDNWEVHSGQVNGGMEKAVAAANDFFQRQCRVCGCTYFKPCDRGNGGCSWTAPDLCSFCIGKPIPVRKGGRS